jgi:hypothetical protein
MLAREDGWWSGLSWLTRLHMNRLMFAPLGRVAHVGLYFILVMAAVAANDNQERPPGRAG